MKIRTLRMAVAGVLFGFAGLVPGVDDLDAQSVGRVGGQVVSTADISVAGTEVRLVALGRVARVEADGRFTFEAVPEGRYVVTAFNAVAGTITMEITVTAGETTRVELELDPLFHLEEVFVSVAGEPVTENDLYQAASALSGRELRASIQPTLGETLAGEPGVTSSYFGPGSSRPVIRGLGGDRVRVLEAGIGTGDASSVSADHAVSVEPQMAERIEIIRGPATLLYGSSAVGGAVNVVDNRIPDELPDREITGALTAQAGSVADERNVSGELNGALGRVAWHLGGLLRDTDDYSIPGFAEEGGHEGEPGAEEAIEGTLPNSFIETSRGSAGLSYVGSSGFIGVSFSGFDTEYGIPPGAHGHHEEEEGLEEEGDLVSIDMRQRRGDLRGAWRFGTGLIQGLKVRLGVTDYQHTELEGDEIGTVFDNEEWEGRAEAQTRFADLLHGAVGLQLGSRDFSAIGEEAFTPPSETDQLGIFTFQEIDLGSVRVQGGARYESRDVTNTTTGVSRDFDEVSVSGGLNWSATDVVGVRLSVGRSVKLPAVEELFSDGPHLATQSFEIGRDDLEPESAVNVDLGLRLDAGRVHGEVSGYATDFTDFIFQRFTGEEEDELPVLEYTQGDAVFTGVEGSLEVDLFELPRTRLGLELFGDYVRAELSETDQPLPRITPARLGVGVLLRGSPWDANVRLAHTTEQDRVAPNEEPTQSYTMLSARVGYRLFTGGVLHELVLQGRNLTDEEARNHVSLIKEFAPLPGREIRLMYRLAF